MSDGRQYQPGLSEFESALASLQPVPPEVDRDELMFRAGQAAAFGHRSPLARGFWPATAASLACLSLALGISLAQKHADGIDRRPIGDRTTTAEPLPVESETEAQQIVPKRLPTASAMPDRVAQAEAFVTPDVSRRLLGVGPPESYLALRNWLLTAGVSAWNDASDHSRYRYPRNATGREGSPRIEPTWKRLNELYREAVTQSTGENS